MEKKSILITGCSSGIGLCTAKLLKERGYEVFATARKPSDVAKLKELGFFSVQLDVDDSQSIENALSEILKITQGKLYALFNNSGYVQPGAIEDLSRDILRAQFETNVFGAMELIKLVLPIMRKQGYGRIIQNSSVMGYITVPFYSAYGASKYALEAFSRTLRQELNRDKNIFVSIINPGPIRTDIRQNAYQHYQEAFKGKKSSPYEKVYRKLEHSYFDTKKKEIGSINPEVVTQKVIHALESKRPRRRYYVGSIATSLGIISKIIPESLLDSLLTKIMGW